MKASTSLWFVLGLAGTGLAAGIGGGFTNGPDENFLVNMTLFNAPASTADIVNILLDGSTAAAFPILWDSPGTPSGPPGTNIFFSGVDTQFLTIGFFDGGNGFDPGESMTLSGMDPDGDPGPGNVNIAQLAGVRALFNFDDGSLWLGVLVDDPTPGAGLVLTIIPVPSAIVLGALGTSLIACLRRRRVL